MAERVTSPRSFVNISERRRREAERGCRGREINWWFGRRKRRRGGGWVLRVEGEALQERNEETNRIGGREEGEKRFPNTRKREGKAKEKKGGLSLASTTGWLQVIHSAIIVRC